MSDQTQGMSVGRTLASLREINRLCEQFEDDWQAGRSPSLKEYVNNYQGSDKTQLFAFLLELELEYLRSREKDVDEATYQERFPEFTKQISAVFSGDATIIASDHYDPHETRLDNNLIGPDPDALSPLEQGKRIGDYLLYEVIGRGGMGVVFRAKQVPLDRIVALKMVRSGYVEGSLRERFRGEATAAAKLEHDGIVPVYHVGEENNQLYFSMAYVDGGSLSSRVAGAPLEPRQAADIVMHVADAIEYAHQQGIIHRDLKPGNILIDRLGRPKVTDFGLAKSVDTDSDLTVTGQVLGTPAYMPPEQAQGRIDDINEVSDVYSLGAVLYHTLTGQPPFKAPNSYEIIYQVINQEPIPPRRHHARIDLDLETICLRCLEKDPKRRFHTAAEMRDELKRFLDGRPILSRRIHPATKLVRWCRRNPLVSGLASLAMIAMVAGTIISSLFAIEANQRAKNERELKQHAQTQESELRQLYYFSQMNSAGYASESTSGMERVREIVSEFERSSDASSDEPDLRGWEWYLLYARSHPELDESKIVDAERPIYAVAESKHGVLAIAQAYDILLVDRESGEWLAEFPAHDSIVLDIAFGPEGRRIASVGLDGTARIWNVADQSLVAEFIHQFDNTEREMMHSVDFSPDGDRIVTYANEKGGNIFESHMSRVRVWNIATQDVETECRQYIDELANGLAMSASGRMVAVPGFTTNEDRPVLVYDTESGELLAKMPPNESDYGSDRFGIYPGHQSTIQSIDWCPDSRRLVSGGDGVRIWDLSQTPDPLRYSSLVAELITDQEIKTVAWSNDGNLIAAGGRDCVVRVWDVATHRLVHEYVGHSEPVTGLSWSQSDRYLVSSSSSGKARTWDLQAINALTKLPLSNPNQDTEKTSLSWSPDGKWLSATYGDYTAIWDTAGYSKRTTSVDQLTNIQWSPDGELAVALRGGEFLILDASLATIVTEVIPQSYFADEINGFAVKIVWSPDSDQVLWRSVHQALRWKRDDNQVEVVLPEASMSFSYGRTGKEAFASHGDAAFIRYNTETWRNELLFEYETVEDEDIASMRIGGMISEFGWAPDRNRLVTSHLDHHLRVWQLEPQKLVHLLQSHTSRVTCVSWSPSGDRIASGGEDQMVIIWDPIRGEPSLHLRHDELIREVEWNHNGERLATLSNSGTVIIWDAGAGRSQLSANVR